MARPSSWRGFPAISIGASSGGSCASRTPSVTACSRPPAAPGPPRRTLKGSPPSSRERCGPGLRKLGYFVVIAEHLNFSRSGEPPHIAQPVLYRQIRSARARPQGAAVRTGQAGARLSPAGQAFLDDARALLSAADAARRRVAGTATGVRTFTVGFMPA
jgi:hypothetical protein